MSDNNLVTSTLALPPESGRTQPGADAQSIPSRILISQMTYLLSPTHTTQTCWATLC